MTVSNSLLGGTQPQGGEAAPRAAAPAGMSEMFMTLLTAQIRNQNPLDPADPAQFVSQLVQMNQMQSGQQMLAELKGNGALLRELQGLALGAQVGSRVLVQAEQATLGAAPLHGRVTLEGDEQQVSLLLTGPDQRQTVVALGRQPGCEFAFTLEPARYGLVPGRYQLALQTASGSQAQLALEGRVEGIELGAAGGTPYLHLTGLGSVPASSLTRLLGGGVAPASSTESS